MPMRHRPISVIAVVGGMVVAVTVTSTGPSAADPPANVSVPASLPCAVAKTVAPVTGVLILDAEGSGAMTPAPGQSVSQVIDFKVGPPQHMSLFRHADGTLEIEGCGEEDASDAYGEPVQTGADSVLSSPSECNDSTYGLNGKYLTHAFHWSYQAGTTPSNLTTAQATGAIQDGRAAITGINNNCGMEAFFPIWFKAVYDGTITGGNSVTTGGNCSQFLSGTSVANFQNFTDPNTLGVTCTYPASGPVSESDVSFNKNQTKWVVGDGGAGCTDSFSLKGIATHESGHTFGLVDLDPDLHGNLTMAGSGAPCTLAKYTLGRGDVLGVDALY